MNYQEILERFSYEDDSGILERINKANTSIQEDKDIINEIVLWKLNRMVKVEDDVIEQIKSLPDYKSPLELVNDTKIIHILEKLLSSKGIQLPMASTILHFYYPDLFPIIDQRSYREVYKKELPSFHSKDKIQKYSTLYLTYIKDCFRYKENNCSEVPFRYIDKILYQLDKEKGNKGKY